MQEGIGETGTFFRYHPIVNFIYFVIAAGITMFASHPLFLAVSFFCAWTYFLLLMGKKRVRSTLGAMGILTAVITLFNMVFVHNGATVLCYLNGQRITLEAGIYGMVSGIMLTTVLIWMRNFQVIMTTDKFLCLFGRVMPSLALTISMVMRYIPLIRRRYQKVTMGQRCMGRTGASMNFLQKISQRAKEISIVTAWSLEAAIETGDSMEARGYGLRGRTSFHLYRFTGKDLFLLCVFGVLGFQVTAACAAGMMRLYYYPVVQWKPLHPVQWLTAVCYGIFLILPCAIDWHGQKIWQKEVQSTDECHRGI